MLQFIWVWLGYKLLALQNEMFQIVYMPWLLWTLVGSSLCVLVWRLWTFTIRPYLRPQDPKELPYWIPFFGHTLAFFSDANELFERGFDFIGRTHEIYAIKFSGQVFYIVTAPQDVAAAYRNNSTLSFAGHLHELLVNFGVKGEDLRLTWHTPQPGESCYLPDNPVNPQQKSLGLLTEELFKKQLLDGDKMNVISKVFITALENTLRWDNLNFCTVVCNGNQKQISLSALCRYAVVDAVTRSLFGSHLHQIKPNIVERMLEFNDFAWMLFFRCPNIYASPVSAPRREVMEALKAFINSPEEERSEQAWFIKTILTAHEIVGIDLQARASMILMMYWTANFSEYSIAFWVLSHLLFNEDLLKLVRAETEAAWQDETLRVKYLCTHSPNLDAIFCEVLRLNSGAMSTRRILSPTEIGGKVLQPGNFLLIPSRQLHKNKEVWGSDVSEFDAFRFVKNKGLARHSSYRPFGGGESYCPGRTLAKEEVFGFIAILLHRFNIKLARLGHVKGEKQVFPQVEVSTPGLGITGPAKNMDVIVDMALRETVV